MAGNRACENILLKICSIIGRMSAKPAHSSLPHTLSGPADAFLFSPLV